MSRKKLLWQLFLSYLLILAAALLMVMWYSLESFRPFYTDQASFEILVRKIVTVGMGVAVLAALLSLFLSRRISMPLAEIRKGAQRFARGDFNRSVIVETNTEEIVGLADDMNRMAGQLSERIRMISEQQSQQEAIFSSMVEGVLAVSIDGQLMSLNEAARKLLRIYQQDCHGKDLQEIVRNSELQKFVEEALSGEESVEGDIVVYSGGERHIQVHGTILKGVDGAKIGILIVLHDVTRILKLESLRKDFVANVSHELKTPLTSIKGFVEMLLDSDRSDPSDAKEFLKIILRQTDRLNEIIEDLLKLSKIERDAENDRVHFEPTQLRSVLARAIDLCASRWNKRHPSIGLECEEGLTPDINPRLFEQAVTNLVDNALKYGDDGQPVVVRAFRKAREVVVQVIDQGGGIAEEHLPRLFERFYRVDKARSRDVGGSGLGLAIVKHIVQAHGGFVTARSEIGKGSEFSIHIPMA